MREEEYRALLRKYGYSEPYIERELKQLREAREHHGLPGAAQPTERDRAGDSPTDHAVER